MKLKFPAIFSGARSGSRGAWTGNSLLPYAASLKSSTNALKYQMQPQLFESPVTCLEGDRPNKVRIQATGKHVAGLPPTTKDGIDGIHPIEAYSVSLFPVINMKRRRENNSSEFYCFLKNTCTCHKGFI
ncbi:hypothetical protein ACFVS2_15210 [Brevibacillus sp. NPDC058079]|uniref:hypothetical protein n=1 Tax=Brevibacillus sp. NPDC058079 TaxID=3346330 RepID=UPI0036E88B7D